MLECCAVDDCANYLYREIKCIISHWAERFCIAAFLLCYMNERGEVIKYIEDGDDK
ncbi:hypothetical protein MACH09_45100 [Vibrio sp. MACH09]|nr:hypothetical protein MACH09_45100 [Vibrio sp. MACH09]